jgi:hypothetical protein
MNRHPPALNVGGHDAQGGLAHSTMSLSVLITLQFASGFDFKLKRGQYLGPYGPGRRQMPLIRVLQVRSLRPEPGRRQGPGGRPRAPEAWRSRRIGICVH